MNQSEPAIRSYPPHRWFDQQGRVRAQGCLGVSNRQGSFQIELSLRSPFGYRVEPSIEPAEVGRVQTKGPIHKASAPCA